MQRGSNTIIVSAALLIALAGCGAGSDARTPTERWIAALDEQADLFDEMADAIGGIESQATANTVATRLEGDFTPRLESILGSMLRVLEDMTEEERATLRERTRADEDLRATLERLERSAQRFDERATRLEPRFVTSAFEEAMLAVGQSGERFGARMTEIVGDDAPQPAAGDAAWCQEMANKPQAQWTMDEAFAFANRCVGR